MEMSSQLFLKQLDTFEQFNNKNTREVEQLKISLSKLYRSAQLRLSSKDKNLKALKIFHQEFSIIKNTLNHMQTKLKIQNTTALNQQKIIHFSLILIFSFLLTSALLFFFTSKQKHLKLITEQQQLIEILNISPDLISLISTEGTILYLNPAGRHIMKITEEEILDKSLIIHFHPREDAEKLIKKGLTTAKKEGKWQGNMTYIDKKGGIHETSQVILRHLDTKKNIKYYSIIAKDISTQLKIENDLKIAAKVFDTSSEAILITNADNKIINVNAAFSYLTGYSKENVLGKNPNLLSSGKQDKAFYERLWTTLQAKGRWQGEIINKKKNGEIYHEWLSIVMIKDENNQPTQYISIFSDITERKQKELLIKKQATMDKLTKLPNRRLFDDRLALMINLAKRNNNEFALFFIDLDHFKEVNDTLGHDYGDELLKQSADRMKQCIRESDTLARIGGDEFSILLQSVTQKNCIALIAEKLLEQMARPFNIKGIKANISLSIGIARYPCDGDNIDNLLKAADKAMYKVKESGRNNYHFTKV